MVGANLKADAMNLMEKRSGIEAEMNVIIQRLCQSGGPGLSGNLLDSEGFPRADIDIPAVRADRQRLSELRNDYEDTTEKINQKIQVLHSAKLAPISDSIKDPGVVAGLNTQEGDNLGTSSSFGNPIAGGSNSMDMEVVVASSRPFAMVDEITEGSPAATDGLQLGDQIVKFGNVEIGENLLQRLAAEAQINQGHAMPVVIMRQGALINLTVKPRSWSGHGLLGCHFRIL
ncbi:26S proteasome non-ATPase regulatory subunit 9 isoform X1 [Olea europaea var. sylvestris]|uniref:26S proteasome non-ATPase regulatory subunit 9 isoform X1 n=1 Tax=Olea europaea var. sylvestris TaxID=158386 RepID=UPI000C1CD4FF|nr:26S proteasome non-ATPase regulatory subunit 9 isoform X1 [Olea europaea var. sylvestris]